MDDIAPLVERALAGAATWAEDSHLVMTRNGVEEDTWWTFAYSPLRDDHGVIRGFLDIATDTTAKVLNERRLSAAMRDLEDFTRLALTSVGGVGAWTFDVASDRFVCDGAVSALYGIDPAEGAAGISRERFLVNVLPEDRPALAAVMAGGLQRAGDLELEYRLRHADGSIHWVLSRGHTYHEDGRPVRRTGVAIDTTRRRQLEEQLRQSQKMEAVGQLTGGIAHDFNNLLTGITGSLEMIQNRVAQGRVEAIDRYIAAAQGAARRAAALTHRLLAFSRRQTLDPKVTDVNGLIAGMEELIRRSVGPEVRITVAGTEGLWPTLVDPNQLENALLNLCINARDAMPDGGAITIQTANRTLDGAGAAALGLPPGAYVALSVADTGTGMTPQVIARAFDPFFTTKPIGAGTGLGLSMIYGFAQQSGGQVRIDSTVGARRHHHPLPAARPCRPGAGRGERRAGPPAGGRGGGGGAGDRGRAHHPHAGRRGAGGVRLRLHRGQRRDAGAEHPAVRRADRPSDHRRGPAWRAERAPDRRRRPHAAPRAEGAVHHRLCAECGGGRRGPRSRDAGDDQALRHGRPGGPHPRDDRGLGRGGAAPGAGRQRSSSSRSAGARRAKPAFRRTTIR